MLIRVRYTAKILSQRVEAERSRSAQGPGKRPAPSRQVQARQAGMQVHTPARQPGRRVGLDGVPSCYEAKQAGLDRTLLAAYTGTHYGRIRGMLLGARGHYTTKSTASASLKHRPGTAMVRPAVVLAVLAWPGRPMWSECGARCPRPPRAPGAGRPGTAFTASTRKPASGTTRKPASGAGRMTGRLRPSAGLRLRRPAPC
jgi:hypothetical protein